MTMKELAASKEENGLAETIAEELNKKVEELTESMTYITYDGSRRSDPYKVFQIVDEDLCNYYYENVMHKDLYSYVDRITLDKYGWKVRDQDKFRNLLTIAVRA